MQLFKLDYFILKLSPVATSCEFDLSQFIQPLFLEAIDSSVRYILVQCQQENFETVAPVHECLMVLNGHLRRGNART